MNKYEVYVESNFSAAHQLKLYKGKCENLHGHNWKVGIVVSSTKLNDQQMVIDFVKLKKFLNKILDSLDHKCLNKLSFFKTDQPTAENIAKYIYKKLKEKLLHYKNIEKIKIIVWETPIQYASYEE
jgi:6-pyruvoyltetrahydropterin/6-carboxytetrahydropterin synthase